MSSNKKYNVLEEVCSGWRYKQIEYLLEDCGMDEETIIDTINPIVDDYAVLRDLVNRAEKFEETTKKYEEKGQPTDIAKINAKRELELRLNYDEVVKFHEYERNQQNYDEDDAWLNDTIQDKEKPTEDDADGIPLPEDDNDFAEANNETTQETSNETEIDDKDILMNDDLPGLTDEAMMEHFESVFEFLNKNMNRLDMHDGARYFFGMNELLRGYLFDSIDFGIFENLYKKYQEKKENGNENYFVTLFYELAYLMELCSSKYLQYKFQPISSCRIWTKNPFKPTNNSKYIITTNSSSNRRFKNFF